MKTPGERLFFALWPDDAIRQQLVDAYARIPGLKGQRDVLPNNLHVTLHFLGNVEASRVDCFRRQAEVISAHRFQLQLDRFGYFKKARVLWLGCELKSNRLSFDQPGKQLFPQTFYPGRDFS